MATKPETWRVTLIPSRDHIRPDALHFLPAPPPVDTTATARAQVTPPIPAGSPSWPFQDERLSHGPAHHKPFCGRTAGSGTGRGTLGGAPPPLPLRTTQRSARLLPDSKMALEALFFFFFKTIDVGKTVCYGKHYLRFSEGYFLVFSLFADFHLNFLNSTWRVLVAFVTFPGLGTIENIRVKPKRELFQEH